MLLHLLHNAEAKQLEMKIGGVKQSKVSLTCILILQHTPISIFLDVPYYFVSVLERISSKKYTLIPYIEIIQIKMLWLQKSNKNYELPNENLLRKIAFGH